MQSRPITGDCCAASPNGDAVCLTKGAQILKVSILDRRAPAYESSCRLPGTHAKVSAIQWSADASQILVVHDKGVQIAETVQFGVGRERVRLENGSGGLGRIASAHFVGNEQLLAIWEFGKAKLWHMNTGRAIDLPDIKTTCDGRAWQLRPGESTPQLLSALSKTGAEDCLVLIFSALSQPLATVKLPTTDAQSLCWSPDGRWLAILDVPTHKPSLRIYTPDGHLFRSYPSTKEEDISLGIKQIIWSPDDRILALARHDGKIELLNTRTFSPMAVIEHNTTIDQSSLIAEEQAPIWQEHASATNWRSYILQLQPVSPPLSKPNTELELKDIGVAEASFSCDGTFLATRDCRMLNTVWLWDMTTLVAHAVIIQHTNVRSLLWHPTRAGLLMIDCAEGFAHVFDARSRDPPVVLPTGMRVKALLSWVQTAREFKPIILVTEKTRCSTLHPEGNDDPAEESPSQRAAVEAEFDDDAVEDSLLDVLSGRTPLPPKTQPSYTEMVDLEVDAEETMSGELDDTFRDKKLAIPSPDEVDPLDDSQIF